MNQILVTKPHVGKQRVRVECEQPALNSPLLVHVYRIQEGRRWEGREGKREERMEVVKGRYLGVRICKFESLLFL